MPGRPRLVKGRGLWYNNTAVDPGRHRTRIRNARWQERPDSLGFDYGVAVDCTYKWVTARSALEEEQPSSGGSLILLPNHLTVSGTAC